MKHQLYYTEVSGLKPFANQLIPGELAINLADRCLFTKTPQGEIIALNMVGPKGDKGDTGDVANVDLSLYATKTYVDSAVQNVTVDLTGYATETYVNNKVDSLASTSDLQNYYNKTEIDTRFNTLDKVEVIVNDVKPDPSLHKSDFCFSEGQWFVSDGIEWLAFPKQLDGYTKSVIDGFIADLQNKIDLVNTRIDNISLTPGPDGKSAYEIAVEEGFVGTEAEWVQSLKGDKGDKGDSTPTEIEHKSIDDFDIADLDGTFYWDEHVSIVGPQGPKGDRGQDGTNGVDGSSVTATWSGTSLIITDKDGTKPAVDLKGQKGDTGDKGDKGDNGLDGTNGTNGTNGLDSFDEWKVRTNQPTATYSDYQNAFRGLQGIQGQQGIQGLKGDKGDQGEKGEKGDNGLDGTNGVDGSSVTATWSGTSLIITDKDGVKPAVDLKGQKGDTGDQGPQGIQGPQGPIGPPADTTLLLLKAGDTMTGPLVLSGAPTLDNHAATKAYADAYMTFDGSRVSIGDAKTNQGGSSVGIGLEAGKTNQGSNSIAIGRSAGWNAQRANGIAIGFYAGNKNQNLSAIAIGKNAGLDTQGQNSIAIGEGAGQVNQPANSIAIGLNATPSTDGGLHIKSGDGSISFDNVTKEYSLSHVINGVLPTADSHLATKQYVDSKSGSSSAEYTKNELIGNVIINIDAFDSNIGYVTEVIDLNNTKHLDTGLWAQNNGYNIGDKFQLRNHTELVTITEWKSASFGRTRIAFSRNVNETNTSTGTFNTDIVNKVRANVSSLVDIATLEDIKNAGYVLKNTKSIFIGNNAGLEASSISGGIAIGDSAGKSPSSGENHIAIGSYAGVNGQAHWALAIGSYAGQHNQKERTIAIGSNAGNENQKNDSIALGTAAGRLNQGTESIAIGLGAGQVNQPDKSIAIGKDSAPTTIGGLHIKSGDGSISFDNSTKEYSLSHVINGVLPTADSHLATKAYVDSNKTLFKAFADALPTDPNGTIYWE